MGDGEINMNEYHIGINSSEKVKLFNIVSNCADAPMRVDLMGHSICGRDFVIDCKHRDINVIGYCEKGTGFIRTPQGDCVIREGDIFIAGNNIPHYYGTGNCEQWRFFWLNVAGSFFGQLLSVYNLYDKWVFKNIDALDIFEGAMELASTKMESEKKAISLVNKVYELVTTISAYGSSAGISRDTGAIKSFIDNRIYEKLTLEIISRGTNIPAHTITRLFSAEMNTSVHKYIIEKKMEIAKNLLLHTGLSVKEIAFMLSFSDQYYFSNAFKKTVGCSPKKYKK
jgi:AraC-like DNA-binding protein